MTLNLRSIPPNPQGSSESSTTRDRLAVRSSWMDREHPVALDLEAEILDGLSERLRGVVGILADSENQTHSREGLRGERHTHLAFLCRIATSGRPEAAEALDYLLDRLARCRGKVLSLLTPSQLGLLESVRTLSKESGEAIAAAIDALGGHDAERLDRAERELMEQLQAVTGAMAAVRALRGKA